MMNIGVTFRYPTGRTEWDDIPPTQESPTVIDRLAEEFVRALRWIARLGAEGWKLFVGFVQGWCGSSVVPSLPTPSSRGVHAVVQAPPTLRAWSVWQQGTAQTSTPLPSSDVTPPAVSLATPVVPSPSVRPTSLPPAPPKVALERRAAATLGVAREDDLAPPAAPIPVSLSTVDSPRHSLAADPAVETIDRTRHNETDLAQLLTGLQDVDAHADANPDQRDEIYGAARERWWARPRNLLLGREHEILLAIATRELHGSLATKAAARARLFAEVICSTAPAIHCDPADRIEWFARFVAAPISEQALNAEPVRGVFTEPVGAWFAEVPAAPTSRGAGLILTCWESSLEGCVDSRHAQRWTDQLRLRMARADPPRSAAGATIGENQSSRNRLPPACPPGWSAVVSWQLQRVAVRLGQWMRGTPRLELPAASHPPSGGR